jgi:hypothetical protein
MTLFSDKKKVVLISVACLENSNENKLVTN